ncbi:MAG: pyridoxine 5'-phosphate synthase [Deltaproteobacteria bacterium]|nr:MAG: pyridoxine 5'-phosphate synthase [Deltaproteobacteria bacterium]
MALLGVNVDHVATIRQARGGTEPDPVAAAALAELAGADGITVHLREDRRHIQDRDVRLLRQTVQTRLNLEMAATDEMVAIALDILPDSVTLVPEKREELTTEGGLDVCLHRNLIRKQTELLRQGGISVSLFIDPDLEQVKAAHRVGADFIEIHTGSYCEAGNEDLRRRELEKIETALRAGRKLGLGVNAGHGLNYQNVGPVARMSGFHEFNIGHSIVSRAVLVGMDRAVRDMVALIR